MVPSGTPDNTASLLCQSWACQLWYLGGVRERRGDGNFRVRRFRDSDCWRRNGTLRERKAAFCSQSSLVCSCCDLSL